MAEGLDGSILNSESEATREGERRTVEGMVIVPRLSCAGGVMEVGEV